MEKLPQTIVNIRLEDRAALAHAVDAVDAEVGRESAALGVAGAVGPSGTEPLVRVMVEAPTQDHAEAVATRLAGAIERAAL